jgi:demethylspheroidene O-methyltransferase
MDPRFQRLAARFPLSRPFARRSASALFDLTAGFVYAQILKACVELDLFTLLAERPATAAEVAQRAGLTADGAQRLLLAATALGLVGKRSQGRFGLGMLGAALQGNAGVRAMIRHHGLLYGDLADPVALLRGESAPTSLSQYWSYAGSQRPDALDGDSVSRYSDLMATSQSFVAEDVLDAVPMARHKRLLDVAGGEGAFLIAAGRRWPHLALALVDLPAVAERATSRLASAGLSHRVTVRGGNIFRDSLPAGADLVSLVRVVHDHDDGPALALLRSVRRALAPGGTLLIAEPFADMRGAERLGHAYFGLYLAAMGSGRPRTAGELSQMAREAGFSRIETRLTSGALPLGILLAHV